MNPINDNNEQSELGKLFIEFCNCQMRMANELLVMASVLKTMSEKITEIDSWDI